MAVLTLNDEDLATFPQEVREFAIYESGVAGRAEKTVVEYLSDLRTFFRFIRALELGIAVSSEDFTKLDIHDFSLADIEKIKTSQVLRFLDYTKRVRNNDWSARARKLASLRAFYRYMTIKARRITENPVKDIDSPKPRQSLPKHLTLQESMKLLSVIEEDVDSQTRERDYAIVTLFLNCGMRLSELVGIDLQDMDPELQSLRVLGKGGKERIVYLNDACRSAVVEYLKYREITKKANITTPALFLSSRNQRISNKTVQWMVYKYLDLAGLDRRGLSVHKLRHTAATLMYQTGEVDVRVLKDILGHAQLNTTQIYTHVSDKNIEQAIAKNPLAGLSHKKDK